MLTSKHFHWKEERQPEVYGILGIPRLLKVQRMDLFILHHYISKFKIMQTSKFLKAFFLGQIRKNFLISQKFYARTGFPNVVGAIDGPYIPILGTNNIQIHTSVGRGFCFPAIHLQGVCDRYLMFTYVFYWYLVLCMSE